jgi:Phytanoyl-CoA dioxygenase (PhyH)
MSSLDVRTRTPSDVHEVDTAGFFDHELPELIAARAGLAVPGARELGLEPFTIATPSGSWTLALADETISLTSGEHGVAMVRLEDDEVAKMVDDRLTPMTLVSSARLRMERGQLGDFLSWWVVLRSLIDDRAVFTKGSIEFRGSDGRPLDLDRSFSPDDADEDIAEFLAVAGFLHLSGWFEPGEMDAINRDMDDAFPHYTPDDGRSWWAETSAGEHRAVRLQRFEEHSPTAARLLDDERLLRIGRLTGDDYLPRRSVEALEKPIGVVKGISDLVWHKDCSLGMHSYNCSGITVGISVTAADAASGQLAVVPGTHRALVQPAFYRPLWGLPVRDLPTNVGDLTVHCSCTMHMSHPPVTSERRVLYTGFSLTARDGPLGEDAMELRTVREEAYKKVSQAPSPVVAGT